MTNGFEDVDLCLKIGDKGWRCIYQPESVLYHLESQTPGRKAYERENGMRLVQRWGHKWHITDEDAIHYADGYALRYYDEGGILRCRREPLVDPEQKAQFDTVATAQRAAQEKDLTSLTALLSRPDAWPADVWILRWAARVCLYIDHPGLGRPFWERLLTIEEDQDARVALAKECIKEGNLPDAELHVTKLFSKRPDHGEGWLLRGVLAMQREAYVEAGRSFEYALAQHVDQRKARLGIAMSAMGLKQPIRAWDSLIELFKKYPDDSEAIHWLIRAGAQLERWKPLADHLDQYLARNPADLTIRFTLCGVLLRLNQVDAARSECARIRMLNPAYDGLDELETRLGASATNLTSHHAA